MLKRKLRYQTGLLAALFMFASIFSGLSFPVKVSATPNSTIYVYDISTSDKYNNYKSSEVYDEALFVSTLQGIVNRKGPRLYLYHAHKPTIENINNFQANNIDKDVLSELRKAGQWLEGYTVVNLSTIDDLITTFSSEIIGLIAWDPKVDSTVNVATSIAGVEGKPIVLYGSKLYNKLISSPYNKTVSTNLNGQFTGANSKTDAYNWAKTNFLDTKSGDDCKMMSILEDGYAGNPDMIGPEKFAASRDLLVMKKAFVFDLSPWSDERPNDAPEQTLGNDYNCFTSIMQAAQNKWGNSWPVSIIGFTPWWHKYSTFEGKGTHETVSTEWKLMEILSTYGANLSEICDTFGSTNASFHCWAPYPSRMPHQEAPPRKTLGNKTYLLYMNSDQDGSTMSYLLNTLWLDPRRGQVPIAWGVANGIISNYPSLYSYLRATATKNDYFIAGPSGGGYANPGYINPAIWQKFNEYYYDRAGYSMTGFILNGNAGTVSSSIESMYGSFSGDGISSMAGQTTDPDYTVRNGNVAVASISTDIDRANVPAAVNNIAGITAGLQNPGTQPNFIMVRTCFSLPSTIEQINNQLVASYPSYNYEAVDPYTFYSLVRQKTLGQQAYDAVVTNVQWPERMVANEKYDVKVTVRNVGINTWTQSNMYRLGSDTGNQFTWSDWQDGGYSNSLTAQRAYLSSTDSIAPQQTKTFSFKITAPSTAGTYNFNFRMVRDGVQWFGTSYSKHIQVATATANEARLVSVSAPAEVVAGQSASVSFTFKNIGTSTWTAANNYRLGSLVQSITNLKAVNNTFEWTSFPNGGYSNSVTEQRQYLSGADSIAPGQTKTFTFNITAPYGYGKYVLSTRMVRDGYEWFGDDAVTDITVVPSNRSTDNAKSLAVIVPTYVKTGEKVNVSVSVKNRGTSTWTRAANYRLSSTSANQFMFTDMQHGGYSNSATDQRVYMRDMDSVKPEESTTFNFSITAPSTAGTKVLSLKMTNEGVGTFGDQMDVNINVVSSALDSSVRLENIPTQVAAGSENNWVTIAVKNTGHETWTKAAMHRLASTDNNQFTFVLDASEGYGASDGKQQRVFLPDWGNIKQGEEHGFSFRFKAPDIPGTYTFQLQMVKDGVAWFGPILTKTITVVSGYRQYINVGGPSISNDGNGYGWVADQAYTSGSWGYYGTTTTNSTTNTISLSAPYFTTYGQTAYKDSRKGSSWGYKFDSVPNGYYRVRLLFADLGVSTASAQNLTSVKVEGYEAIIAFDVYKNRCGTYKGLIAGDIYATVSDGQLNVELSSLTRNALVNAMIVERVN